MGGPVQGSRNRALILAALPGDLHDVGRTTGLAKTTVWRWLTDLHRKREIHIVKWHRADGGGPYVPTYSPGPGVDAKCNLTALSQAQKSRRHRAKAEKDGRWEDRKARARALYWADRALKHRDPMIEALFGPARRQPETTT